MAAVGDDTINKEADDGDVPVGAGGTTKLLDEGDASTTASRLRGVPGGVVVVARDAVRVPALLDDLWATRSRYVDVGGERASRR